MRPTSYLPSASGVTVSNRSALSRTTLTGTAKGSLTGEGKISDGKINGDTFTFVENTTYMGMPLAFNYTGKMTSADQIELSRTLMEFEAEKATAKRAK